MSNALQFYYDKKKCTLVKWIMFLLDMTISTHLPGSELNFLFWNGPTGKIKNLGYKWKGGINASKFEQDEIQFLKRLV